jgi:hypothetical protein
VKSKQQQRQVGPTLWSFQARGSSTSGCASHWTGTHEDIGCRVEHKRPRARAGWVALLFEIELGVSPLASASAPTKIVQLGPPLRPAPAWILVSRLFDTRANRRNFKPSPRLWVGGRRSSKTELDQRQAEREGSDTIGIKLAIGATNVSSDPQH